MGIYGPRLGEKARLSQIQSFLTQGVRGIVCDGNELGEHPGCISESVIKSNPNKNTERVYFSSQFQATVHHHPGKSRPELEPTNAHSQGQRENDTHACKLS